MKQLICCSVDGDVKGFKAMSSEAMDSASDRDVNQESIRELSTRKQVYR